MKHAKKASFAAGLIALCYALAAELPAYWVFLAMSAVISGLVLQSLGVVVGQAGMISLCQMSFAAIGAWTIGQLNVWGVPGGLYLWTPMAGLAAVPLGLLVGLPALRLRGVHLAIATLGFASAVDVLLLTTTFPGSDSGITIGRPMGLDSDRQYFLFCCTVFAIISVALRSVRRSRLGASWRALRESERAAAAAGTCVPHAKLSAFAVSAFIAGVSGALLAGQLAMVVSRNFDGMQSMAAYAVAVMVGAHHVEGALIGGVLGVLVSELLRRYGIPQQWSSLVFAAGAIQALAQGAGMSDGLRAGVRSRRRRGLHSYSVPESPAAAPDHNTGDPKKFIDKPNALEITGLTVRYGHVTAVDSVDLIVPSGTIVGLVGPNGAGKSSLVDAVSGFISAVEGSVRIAGQSVEGLVVHQRARGGLRRTFQQDRVPTGLTVGEYLQFTACRALTDEDIANGLAGLIAAHPGDHIADLNVGTHRLLEVAGVMLARPVVAVLDEPAGGLAHTESERLGNWLASVPRRYGSAILLIEQDVDLVRTTCERVTVLDFGRVIAQGPPNSVFNQPAVLRAYLGQGEGV
ncbi:ATP-binding cassette domain-containing protein [Streptomyces collinus]|uniref:branched-chain amino acid ABC transporter ATP-binding protein/permease n=1 Tax=Streptomyces collinus TaxID=42684 RepID=UPI0036B11AF7